MMESDAKNYPRPEESQKLIGVSGEALHDRQDSLFFPERKPHTQSANAPGAFETENTGGFFYVRAIGESSTWERSVGE